MKSTFSRMAAVVLTMWLGFAAGTANAAALTFSGWTCSASQCGTPIAFTSVNGSFTDWLDFTLPGGSNGSGASNAISLTTFGSVLFSKFELWESTSLIASGVTGGTTSSLSFSGGAVPGSYKLKIDGSGAGYYTGNIVASPVPEPETFAMMLAGFGLLGFSARRRNNNT